MCLPIEKSNDKTRKAKNLVEERRKREENKLKDKEKNDDEWNKKQKQIGDSKSKYGEKEYKPKEDKSNPKNDTKEKAKKKEAELKGRKDTIEKEERKENEDATGTRSKMNEDKKNEKKRDIVRTKEKEDKQKENDDTLRIKSEIAKADKGHRERLNIQDLYPVQSKIYPKFNDIRSKCLERGILFEDPDFLAAESSLVKVGQLNKPIVWLRPHEIHKQPLFLKDNQASRFDVVQGELGDCWLLAAIANLTLFSELLQKVIPSGQSFTTNYAGIFHFRLWNFGKWIDVIVDDRLPTYKGNLIYLQSAISGEFWSCLLEKAYAKMHGSYEALLGGTISEAMEDLTGGISEVYNLSNIPKDFFDIILKSLGRTSLMGCAIDKSRSKDAIPSKDPKIQEEVLSNGLVMGHAYSVTGVEKVKTEDGEFVKLIRVRNPWGNQTEWNGPWSDRSPEWDRLSKKTKQSLVLKFQYDGEFWMGFNDFIKEFNIVDMLLLTPDSITAENLLKWEVNHIYGEWTQGVNAGGCRVHDTHYKNPQFRITVDCDEASAGKKCAVTIALLQKFKRSTPMSSHLLHIGFTLYNLNDSDLEFEVQPKMFFNTHYPCAKEPRYSNTREIVARYTLPPGVYLIVPSTYDPNQEGSFLLRVFSVFNHRLEQQDVSNNFVYSPKIESSLTEENIEKFVKMSEEIFYEKGNTEIHWNELREILTTFFATISIKYEISDEIFRSALALVDTNHNGRIDVNEFRALVRYLMRWKTAFDNAEKDENGNLAPFQLAETVKLLGYQLSSEVLCMLSHRYATERGAFEFPNFILCAIKVTALMNTFAFRSKGSKRATFDISDWLERTIYS